MISSFTGKYRFLSNFWPARVYETGMWFPTVEHAYQAAKRDDSSYRLLIQSVIKPGEAKRLGRGKQGPDWPTESLRIMIDLLRQKFRIPEIKELLLSTGNEELVEGNTWGDTFWGQCPVGTGENNLGKLIMKVRSEVKVVGRTYPC